jgi:anti-sigma B factor antagonist
MSGELQVGRPTPFDVEVEEADGVTVVLASGELDMATTGELRSCLAGLRDGGRPVRLDMTAVEFMDSSGLHTLIRASEAFTAAGSPFTIVPSEPVLRVLELVDLIGRLPLEQRRDGSGK